MSKLRDSLINDGFIKPSRIVLPNGKPVARRMLRDFKTKTDKAVDILRQASRR